VLSLPARTRSGRNHDEDARAIPLPAPVVVDVRLMGMPQAVAEVTRRLSGVAPVELRFADRPRRAGKGIRRYLTVVLPAEGGTR
jgi:hypothetical protein